MAKQEEMNGFEQYCDDDMDWLLKQFLEQSYGNLREISRLLDIKYPKGKNDIIKLIQGYGVASFKAGQRCQKNADCKFMTEANEARYKAEKKAKSGIYINEALVELCGKHGINKTAVAKALGYSQQYLHAFIQSRKE